MANKKLYEGRGVKRMTPQDEQFIVQKYLEGISAPNILLLMNNKYKTVKTIYDVLSRVGVKIKSKTDYVVVNHFYFSEIDSNRKAYLLGWMISDGWNNEERDSIGIQLQIGDRHIIEWIKNELNSQHKILTIPSKNFVSTNNKTYTSQELLRITAQSPTLSRDLTKYGVTQRKSATTFLPILRPEFMGSLLRGIMDGDGSIYEHSQTKKPTIRFLGSHWLVAQISMYLALTLKTTYSTPKLKQNISLVEWYLPSEVKKIANFLYSDRDLPILERKYEIIKRLID